MEPLGEDAHRSIIRQLTSEIHSHEHTIRRNEARDLGLSYVRDAEEEGINDEMQQLFDEYTALLHLEEPFIPNDEMIANNTEEAEWRDLAIAMVESSMGKDTQRHNVRVTRLREVPPKVELSFPNIQLQLPPMDDGADQEKLAAYVNEKLMPLIQAQIQGVVEGATEQLIKSLPQKGFQHVNFNSLWKRDESPN